MADSSPLPSNGSDGDRMLAISSPDLQRQAPAGDAMASTTGSGQGGHERANEGKATTTTPTTGFGQGGDEVFMDNGNNMSQRVTHVPAELSGRQREQTQLQQQQHMPQQQQQQRMQQQQSWRVQQHQQQQRKQQQQRPSLIGFA